MIKRILKNCISKLGIYSLYCLKKRGYLYDHGWFNSFNTGLSINAQGEGIPWITYPCMDFLETKISKEMRVFEWGCGGSTEWWASKVSQIISVEHNQEWYKKTTEKLADVDENLIKVNFIKLEYNGEYSSFIKNYTKYFDIIVIDGRDRINCVKNALFAIKDDGIIIWDNSERQEYNEGYCYLSKRGYKRLDFWGMGPVNIYGWKTSIFYKDHNNLNI